MCSPDILAITGRYVWVIQMVKIRDDVRNWTINHVHPSEGIYSWWKFREAWSLSLHNLTVLSQIWTCLLLHPPVCPSVSNSDCLHARRPTSCLVCLRAFLPDCLFWFASLHLVTKFICAIPKHPARSPVHLNWLYLSYTQPPLQASVEMEGSKKKKSVFSSATIIRDKEETKASFRTHHFFFKRTCWSHTWKKS